jgi:hypothetical protein
MSNTQHTRVWLLGGHEARIVAHCTDGSVLVQTSAEALSSAPTTSKSVSLEILRTISKALTGSPFSLPPEDRKTALYWVNDSVGALVKQAQRKKVAPT